MPGTLRLATVALRSLPPHHDSPAGSRCVSSLSRRVSQMRSSTSREGSKVGSVDPVRWTMGRGEHRPRSLQFGRPHLDDLSAASDHKASSSRAETAAGTRAATATMVVPLGVGHRSGRQERRRWVCLRQLALRVGRERVHESPGAGLPDPDTHHRAGRAAASADSDRGG